MMMKLENARIAVLGLGYVGLPLAVAFGGKCPTIGFDVNAARVAELRGGRDHTLEVYPDELAAADKLIFSSDPADLAVCNVYIIAVPTPIDEGKRPDLSALIKASETVGSMLKRGDVVIYESTVYPGATEEDCVPVLERISGLTFNQEFFVGYSPERANPGDREHRLATIVKITAGSTPETANFVDALYQQVVIAGTHRAPSIQVAEAAKVIENTQRDLNIALINELAIIFNRLGIDTGSVLQAAGTKWNFLPFRPGLVGGHCIGVDPYYLTHKAEQAGYHPEVILAGRRINDGMGSYVVSELMRAMISKGIDVSKARVLILGLAFKENCPDLRNTRVVDIIKALRGYGLEPEVYDPWADADEARREHGVDIITKIEPATYDAVIIAVAHSHFRAMGAQAVTALGKDRAVIYDLKHLFDLGQSDLRL